MSAILDLLFAGNAAAWVRAHEEERARLSDFEALLIGGDLLAGGEVTDPILPGRDFEEIGYDLSDWDGISLEFSGYVGPPPIAQECERIWSLGFTVIRIDYKDARLNTTQYKFHGDWSCVKGQEARQGNPVTR